MKSKILQEEASRQKRVREEEEDQQDVKRSKNDSMTKKSSKKGKKKSGDSCVVYLGHVPHGFYEKEMRNFFQQFGTVVKLKHFRNPKTKRSRGYAFIKFDSPSVAEEVAESMNGYFLHDRKLVCEIVPIDRQHEGMFLPPKRAIVPDEEVTAGGERSGQNYDPSTNDTNDDEEAIVTLNSNQKRAQLKKQKKLAALGIDYNVFDSFQIAQEST